MYMRGTRPQNAPNDFPTFRGDEQALINTPEKENKIPTDKPVRKVTKMEPNQEKN
jgi:hypothetical protein